MSFTHLNVAGSWGASAARTLERDVYSFNAKIKAEVARGDLSGVAHVPTWLGLAGTCWTFG